MLLDPAWASCGCHSKLVQAGWHQIRILLAFTSLATSSLKSGYQQNRYYLMVLNGLLSLTVKELKGRNNLEGSRWQQRNLRHHKQNHTESVVEETLIGVREYTHSLTDSQGRYPLKAERGSRKPEKKKVSSGIFKASEEFSFPNLDWPG